MAPTAPSLPRGLNAFLRRVLPPLGLEPRPHYRRAVRRKLARRLEHLRLPDLAAYAERLETDPAERLELPALIGVTISRFFRNRALWDFLAAQVLPDRCAAGGLRAWSAGCASGEEPYSLALLWAEVCPGRPLHLLATDLDPAVLARAGAGGPYPPSSLRELPGRLRRHFSPGPRGWELAPEVRGLITLRPHDLLADPLPPLPPLPGGHPFDIILCRNLAFTYFTPAARRDALRRLVSCLAPGGWLAIGRKESLPEPLPGLEPTACPGLFRLAPRG